LLSSRENWQAQNVKGLKEALQKRGLPVSGNKSALIQRLQAYESTQHTLSTDATSPLSPAPSSNNGRVTKRSVSTSPVSAAKAKTPAPPPLPPATTARGPVPESKDTLVSTEAVVNDNREAPGLVEKEGENPAQPDAESAPGLPGAKSVKDSSKKGLVMNVEVPTYREDRDLYAIPPFTPDNFASKGENSMFPAPKSSDALPKVMTVSSTSTHIGGGPSHGVHGTQDYESSGPGVDKQIPALADTIKSVNIPSISELTGFDLGQVVKMPSLAADKKAAKFEPISRPLTDEEKRGAYWLVGILVGGLLIGGPGKTQEEKEEARKRKEERKREKERQKKDKENK
jgi:hypothetical protein